MIMNETTRQLIGRCALVGVLLATAAIGSVSCNNGQRPAVTLMRDGNRHFDKARFSQAAADFQEVVDRYPGDWEAQYRLGLARLELNQPNEARRALEQAHTLRPLNDDVADALAEAMFQQGSENELFAFLRKRADETRSTRSYLNLADFAMKLGDLDAASVASLTAIEVDDGKTIEPYLMRAKFADAIDDHAEATRRLRQAYQINSRSNRVLTALREHGEVPSEGLGLPPGV